MEDYDEISENNLNPVNAIALGALLRSTRRARGFKTTDEVSEILKVKFGLSVSGRTVYAFENGSYFPRLDVFFALLCVYDLTLDAFNFAFSSDVNEQLQKRIVRKW